MGIFTKKVRLGALDRATGQFQLQFGDRLGKPVAAMIAGWWRGRAENALGEIYRQRLMETLNDLEGKSERTYKNGLGSTYYRTALLDVRHALEQTLGANKM